MKKINILLVDDEKEFVTTLSERMQLRHLNSDFALSGGEALQKVAHCPPDVMILDLKMPGMDGMEVMRQIKNNHPDIEVIFLTGHGSKKDETEARRLGAFSYLKKPIDIDTLTQHINSAYKKSRVKESRYEHPSIAG